METEQTTKPSFRQAAEEYDGKSKLFRQLAAYGGDIADLRKKGASYDTISQLLQMDGISVSWKTVARFCRAALGTGGVRIKRGRPNTDSSAIKANQPRTVAEAPGNGHVQAILKERRETLGPWTRRKRGPRIPDSKNL